MSWCKVCICQVAVCSMCGALQQLLREQAVTDAWALGATMPALDEYTVLRVR